MSLFSQKKPANPPAKKARAGKSTKSAAKVVPSVNRDLFAVLVSPRVTEKAMRSSEKNVYTFEVARSATKYDVRDAIKSLYGVTPVKINIVNKTPRQFKVSATRRTRTERGMKKAYVYLKKGDTISLI